jgi:hypothetical protein
MRVWDQAIGIGAPPDSKPFAHMTVFENLLVPRHGVK